MPADLWAFRERAGRAAAKADRGCTVGDADRYTPIADAVIAEFAKPTDTMIDAAYEVVRFDEDWAINSRRALSKAVKAMSACRREGTNRLKPSPNPAGYYPCRVFCARLPDTAG